MSAADASPSTVGHRIALLAGQAFALGLMTSWILVPASAIFLDAYGSGLLPVTYIGAAGAGIATSAALTTAFRRRPLVTVATRVLGGLAISLLACWALLWGAEATWVSFVLLVLVPMLVPVGFMFLVGQAGLLLDVRALKALYARVIAGFAMGFVAGGLIGPLLLAALGGTEHLLAAAAAVAVVFGLLVTATRRAYPTELSMTDDPAADAEPPTLRVLVQNRYLMLIVGFQMLSAVESQWLDYLVYDRAAGRYGDSRELARFVSRFTAITYGADILFLLVVAGLLLRRFGLRYGLTANPGGVLALVAVVIVAGTLQGSGATMVFVLIVAARVSDLVLSDGAARTSLSAAYQVVPPALRQAGQARVEGLAVPVAIGVSGVVLLAVRATVGTDGLALPLLTSIVVVAWAGVALLVHRGYRSSLLDSLRYRSLDPAALSLEDPNSLVLIDQLVGSSDARDVRLGLDTLTSAAHPALVGWLERLAVDERVHVRTDALERLASVDGGLAAASARRGLDHANPEVRARCVKVLGTVGTPADLASLEAHWDDARPEVRVAVAAAVAGIGDDDARARAGAEITRLSRSVDPADRVVASEMLAACSAGAGLDRSPLRRLLDDPEPEVANAALTAVRSPDDAALLAAAVARLHDRRTAGAAVDALVRAGDDALTAVDRALGDPGVDRRVQVLLARVCRAIGGATGAAVLRRHLEHPDREAGLAVMTALGALVPGPRGGRDVAPSPPPAGADGSAVEVVLDADLEHAAHVLCALVALEAEPSAHLVCVALRDELQLLRRRLLAGLSTRHGEEALKRVTFQLAQQDPRANALALEWLDVTLSGPDRAVLALVEPGLSDAARLRSLTRLFPIAPIAPTAVLRDLVDDGQGRWRRPWLRACAVHALSSLTGHATDEIAAAGTPGIAIEDADEHAGIVHETLAGLRARRAAGLAPSRLDRPLAGAGGLGTPPRLGG